MRGLIPAFLLSSLWEAINVYRRIPENTSGCGYQDNLRRNMPLFHHPVVCALFKVHHKTLEAVS